MKAKCDTLPTQYHLTPNSRLDIPKAPKEFKLTRGFEQSCLSYLGFGLSLRSQFIVGAITGLPPDLGQAPDFDICPPGSPFC